MILTFFTIITCMCDIACSDWQNGQKKVFGSKLDQQQVCLTFDFQEGAKGRGDGIQMKSSATNHCWPLFSVFLAST